MRLIDADALYEREYARLREGEVLEYFEPMDIDSMPTVEERKTGHWQSDVVEMRMIYTCSVCGERSLYEEGDYDPVLSNYCPFCGAKMEGEE